MKKVLLLNPPGTRKFLRDQYCSSAAKADYYWPAIDLLVLSGILKGHFDIEAVDAIAQGYDRNFTLEKIRETQYYAIISLSSNASMDEDFTLFEEIKTVSPALLVLNGGFLRHMPQEYLSRYGFIDAVITDYIKNGIVDYLQKKTGPYQGLWYKQAGEVFKPADNGRGREFFSYPVPRHELFPLDKYEMPQSADKLFTCSLISYGCRFNCKYCSSGAIDFRLREIGNIIEELKAIKALGISEVHFPDFTFNADPGHCRAVCRAMIEHGLDISWDCLARADHFDEGLAGLMKQAGAHTVQFGVETQNEDLLKKMAKPVRRAQIRQAFDICKKSGIRTIGFFMIGLPGEDRTSIKKTIDFACSLDCDYASFSVYVPDFGSEMRKELLKGNPALAELTGFDRTGFPLIDNGLLSREEVWQLRNYAIRRFYLRPKYILKQMLNAGSFKNLRAMSKSGVFLLKNNPKANKG